MGQITIRPGRAESLQLSIAGEIEKTVSKFEFRVAPVSMNQISGNSYFTAASDVANSNGSIISETDQGDPITATVELAAADTILLPTAFVNGRHPRAAYELLYVSGGARYTIEIGDVVIMIPAEP